MGKEQYGTREYWEKRLTSVLQIIEEDKDKLLDIIMDKCLEMEITIPCNGEVPTYKVTFAKVAVEGINEIKNDI